MNAVSLIGSPKTSVNTSKITVVNISNYPPFDTLSDPAPGALPLHYNTQLPRTVSCLLSIPFPYNISLLFSHYSKLPHDKTTNKHLTFRHRKTRKIGTQFMLLR